MFRSGRHGGRGGERMRGLGLGFTKPVGTGGRRRYTPDITQLLFLDFAQAGWKVIIICKHMR